mmetsp:Transcript_42999/g.67431  ORF Transcript_42999/g.67431 Transcript_42999/m.67431 type:complete len:137 (+) Transcript_42999:182-592(+)
MCAKCIVWGFSVFLVAHGGPLAGCDSCSSFKIGASMGFSSEGIGERRRRWMRNDSTTHLTHDHFADSVQGQKTHRLFDLNGYLINSNHDIRGDEGSKYHHCIRKSQSKERHGNARQPYDEQSRSKSSVCRKNWRGQ